MERALARVRDGTRREWRSLDRAARWAGRAGRRTSRSHRTGSTITPSSEPWPAARPDGDIERAVEVASSRYAMARAPLMRMDARWVVEDTERLLAALLFPASGSDRAALVRRWLRPQRQPSEV